MNKISWVTEKPGQAGAIESLGKEERSVDIRQSQLGIWDYQAWRGEPGGTEPGM